MDGMNDTGIGAFSALYAFFVVEYDTAAIPFRQCAGRADGNAGSFVGTGQAIRREKLAGFQAAQGTHFDCAFVVGIAFVVYAGTDPLARKATDTFVHVIRFQNFTHTPYP